MEQKAISQSSWLSSDQQKVQPIYCCNRLCISKSSDSQQHCWRASDQDQPIFRRGKALFSRVHSSALCLHVLDQISRGGLFPQSGVSAALAVSGVLWLAPWFPPSSVPGQCLCLAPVCCRTSCSTCGCSFNHRNQAVVRMIPTTICGQLLLQCCCSVLIVKGKLPTPQKKKLSEPKVGKIWGQSNGVSVCNGHRALSQLLKWQSVQHALFLELFGQIFYPFRNFLNTFGK